MTPVAARTGQRPARPGRRLWRRLWAWTLVALLAVWATLAAMAYYTGLHEADEVSDGQLVSVAELLLQMNPDAPATAPSGARLAAATGYSPRLHAVLWTGDRVAWDPEGIAALLPPTLAPGHHHLTFALRGPATAWRAFFAETRAGEAPRRVVVLVDRSRRTALARDFSEHLVRPALVLLPLVAVLLAFAIRGGLRPLEDLAREIEQLDVDAGRPLQAAWHHRELAGTVVAINTLVDRLQSQLQRERRFTSDVAHELRTPLTALVLQARSATDAAEPALREQALGHVERESMRAARILGQLLDFTRAQSLAAVASDAVDLVALAREVVAGHAPHAHAHGREISLVAPDAEVTVSGQAAMIELALRNLLDNALRHTPAGTQIEVRVALDAAGAASVAVVDDGARRRSRSDDETETPGGGEGLGIGLTLVERIADWHGAGFDRDSPEPPFTTAFRLTWPRRSPPSAPVSARLSGA